jgi:hypothetical protein
MTKQGLYELVLTEFQDNPLQASSEVERVRDTLIRVRHKLTLVYGEAVAENVSQMLETQFSRCVYADVSKYIRARIAASRDFDSLTARREEAEAFDADYDTETSSIYEQLQLPERVDPQRVVECVRYTPSPTRSVKFSLDRLAENGVRYETFSFIDIGAGLGRNLLIALDYPFNRIIGVEISQFLHEKSVANIGKYQAKHPNKTPIEAVHMDALDYELPHGDLLLYFWQPFGKQSADRFAARMERHVLSTDTRMVAVFLGSAFDGIKRSGHFRLFDIFETPDATISEESASFVVSVFASKRS